ncbi:MAG: septal ring lytic transglycosylase RlpA family protein [Spirochaetaceae bacterium]
MMRRLFLRRISPWGAPLLTILALSLLAALPVSAEDFEREGLASWYGGKFHGRLTANGERYDADRLTAAHRTLPFGTVVKVTNLGNGESVTVRINDRGPFVDDRIIDLSRGAAERIGMTGAGVARVRLEILHTGRSDPGTRVIQIGSFSMEDNAEAIVDRLSDEGFEPAIEEGDGGVYRVTLEEVPEDKVEEYRRRLSRLGYSHVLVRQR